MISLHSDPDKIDQLKVQLDAAGCVCRVTNQGCILTIFGGLPPMTRDEALAITGLGDRKEDDSADSAMGRDGS